MPSRSTLDASLTAEDGVTLDVSISDPDTLEALRSALGDPVWLLGATWKILVTNDYKFGQFVDALGAWAARRSGQDVLDALADTGVSVTTH